MAFNAELAARIRKQLGKRAGLTEKQMFGGLAFLLVRPAGLSRADALAKWVGAGVKYASSLPAK